MLHPAPVWNTVPQVISQLCLFYSFLNDFNYKFDVLHKEINPTTHFQCNKDISMHLRYFGPVVENGVREHERIAIFARNECFFCVHFFKFHTLYNC